MNNVPLKVHRRLRMDAQEHRRVVTTHAAEAESPGAQGSPSGDRSCPPPVKLVTPLTDAFLVRARTWGRA